jgi:Ca2+-dependent lipid-binding protein
MTDSKSGILNGRLTITLKYGKDLAEKDVGKQDPYCKIHIANTKEKYKSKVHSKGGKNPVWDQSFIFNLKGVKVSEIFHLTCWDEDMLSDDYWSRGHSIIFSAVKKRKDSF